MDKVRGTDRRTEPSVGHETGLVQSRRRFLRSGVTAGAGGLLAAAGGIALAWIH